MLNVSVLVTELRKFGDSTFAGFEGFPSSKNAAKEAWTQAYAAYAASAEDTSGDSVVSANSAGFKSNLAFEQDNTSADAAKEFDDAFVAYWTGATFAVGALPPPSGDCANVGGNGTFGVETTSVVTSVQTNVLKNKLLPVMATPAPLALPQIQAIAQAFHEATTEAVKVLISGTDTTPTPAGPHPITNTCEIK